MNESGKESRESNRQKLTQETNQNTQLVVRIVQNWLVHLILAFGPKESINCLFHLVVF